MKTYFHISHYKSMETLSCHRDKCTWANAIKKHSFCRGTYYEHFCKVSASSPLWLLRRWFFLIFFRKFNILVAMATNPLNQSNSAVWKKFIYMLGRGLLKEHFCKTFIKYICSETIINANFPLYVSDSNQSSYPTGTKQSFFFRSPGL